MQLPGSTLTFNPDLVFALDDAVADVKYKLSADQWSRADLYQVTAFAEAYGASHAAIVRFRDGAHAALAPLQVGGIRVSELTWPCDLDVTPTEAEVSLTRATEAWLNTAMPLPLNASVSTTS